MSDLNLPYHSLRLFPFVLAPVACEKRPIAILLLLPQAAVESSRVPLSLLQAKYPQLPQPLHIGLVLHTLPQLHCISLETLLRLAVLAGQRGREPGRAEGKRGRSPPAAPPAGTAAVA